MEQIPTEDYLKLMREYAELKLMHECLKESKRGARQTFRYYGAKWVLANWIISHFPLHDLYLEPFFGSGAVFFTKPRSRLEIVNDNNGEIVHFFRILRDHPDALVRAIALTPYAECEYESVFDGLSVDGVERARRFYVRLKMSWASSWKRDTFRRKRGKRSGGGGDANPVEEFLTISHLYEAAGRLKDAQIDCAQAVDQIERYSNPDALIYLDPPYVSGTRGQKARYESEMTDEQHRELACVARASPSMIIISGYPSSLYDELYRGWGCVQRDAVDMSHKSRIECLWINPAAQSQKQRLLF